MILKIFSDASSYLSEQQGCIRVGGHFYLRNHDPTMEVTNGPILNNTGILANVMAEASEAEAVALSTNMKDGVLHQTALKEMGWPQPPTHITVDKSTAAGLAQDTIKANKSRAMDRRPHWIQYHAQQQQFNVAGQLEPSIRLITLQNSMPHASLLHASCLPPHYPTNHHSSSASSQPELQGCVETWTTIMSYSPGSRQKYWSTILLV